jgi:hypothetical protein
MNPVFLNEMLLSNEAFPFLIAVLFNQLNRCLNNKNTLAFLRKNKTIISIMMSRTYTAIGAGNFQKAQKRRASLTNTLTTATPSQLQRHLSYHTASVLSAKASALFFARTV